MDIFEEKTIKRHGKLIVSGATLSAVWIFTGGDNNINIFSVEIYKMPALFILSLTSITLWITWYMAFIYDDRVVTAKEYVDDIKELLQNFSDRDQLETFINDHLDKESAEVNKDTFYVFLPEKVLGVLGKLAPLYFRNFQIETALRLNPLSPNRNTQERKKLDKILEDFESDGVILSEFENHSNKVTTNIENILTKFSLSGSDKKALQQRMFYYRVGYFIHKYSGWIILWVSVLTLMYCAYEVPIKWVSYWFNPDPAP